MQNNFLTIYLSLIKENNNVWKIQLFRFSLLIYPLFRLFEIPIFSSPIGIVVSSAEEISPLITQLAPFSDTDKLTPMHSRKLIDAAIHEDSHEFVPFLFLRSKEDFLGLQYLSELASSFALPIGRRIPLVFFIGGIPEAAKPFLAGKIEFDYCPQSLSKTRLREMQFNLIDFLKNAASISFPAFAIMSKELDSHTFWINKSASLLVDFFESMISDSAQMNTIKLRIGEAKTSILNDWDSLANADDIPRFFLSALDDLSRDLPGILNREAVELKDDPFIGQWPLYDDENYFITGSHLRQLTRKMLSFASESEIRDSLAAHGILSRSNVTKPVYGKKIAIKFENGAIKKVYYFPIPRHFVDHIGDLSWMEKILMEEKTDAEKRLSFSDNRNDPQQLPSTKDLTP